MICLPYVLTSVAFVVFALAIIARIFFWVRLPAHLRWELYPVPHEPPDKARYGGSFMEDSDWWNRPHRTFPLGALKAMATEILLLSAVREHNRQLWLRTFPFHFGLYLVSAAVGLALLAGFLQRLVPYWFDPSLREFARACVLGLGVPGFSLGGMGAAALLYRRLTAVELKRFTVPADIFNLALFLGAFGCALLTWVLADLDARRAMAFAANLVSLRWDEPIGEGSASVLPSIAVAFLSALVAYVPFTHMSHFVGKYFAYHAIRWNDTPNLAGGPEEPTIRRMLAYRVSWAAKHIQGHGTRTWADLATAEPTESKP